MDAMRKSTELMQPSSSPSRPLSGVITRCKYNLRHRKPTGHIQSSSEGCRSDLVNYSSDDDDHILLSDLCKKAMLGRESSVGDDSNPSHILIKDLRARRVYSPQSVGGTFSNSSQNVDPKDTRVGSICTDLEMVDSGSGSASTVENNGRVGEISKRDSETDNLGERLPSEDLCKEEINSILSSIAKEYQSEKDDDVHLDGALDPKNEEDESPVVGVPYKAQNLAHSNHESMGEGKQLQYFNDCHDGRGASERINNLNGVPKLTTPPDIETCGNVRVDEGGGRQVEGIHIKDTQLTGNTDENAEEPFCPNADNKNYSVLKSKYVLRPRLQRKLFKSPGSVSYRRMLPFIMNMIKDDSGTSIMGHRQNVGKVVDAKKIQCPLPSSSQEALKDQFLTDSFSANDTDGFRVLADNSDLSGDTEPKLMPYQGLPELPMPLSSKEVAHDCSFVPSVNEHFENVEISLKCSSNRKADVAVDVHCDGDVANAVHRNVHGGNAKAIDGGDTLEKICVVNQECLSPIDADTCDENKNTPGSSDLVKTMDLTPSALANAGEGSHPNATKGKDNVLRSKSVLKPCLQRKLFKTPGSVSYKRLLPFLKDIGKDDCGALKSGHHLKDERRGMGSQLPSLFQSQESTVDDLKTDGCPVSDTVDEVNVVDDTTSVDTLFNGDSNLESSPDLSDSVARIDSSFTSSSPIINEVIPGENATSASLQLSVCTVTKEDSSIGETPLDTNGCCRKLQMKAFEKPTIATVGFKKGILKRNPRGCRGLCTCLNCASFRLHAERAFEFSRNQFLDAEEVALDLMKELSHLRSMLERRTDGANKHSVPDENQVKEACRKAFASEQLAKDRLSQMNDDLNIHCRIPCWQQPRVKFANHIEEKIISPGRLFRQE